MRILAKCLKCGSIIRDIKMQLVVNDKKPADENDINDLVREAHEMKAAGFLKLWCDVCNCRVDFETERVKG